MARDYYEVLGVDRDAGADELQRAFRTLARRHHPDISKAPDAEERFKEINEAYHVLSDPETRRRYDRFGADFRRVPEGFEEAAGAGGRGAGRPTASGGRIAVAPRASTWTISSATCSAVARPAPVDRGRTRSARTARPS